MTELMLESPLKLLLAELAVALLLLGLVRWRGWPAGRVLGGYLLLCCVLLGVQYVVVTDAEKIRRVVQEMADAVDFGRLEVIESHLGGGFDAWGYDRMAFLELVRRNLEHYRVEEVWVGGEEVRVEGNRGQVEFTARARIGTAELGLQPYIERWQLTLHRDGDGVWRVTGVDNLGWAGSPSLFQPGR